MERRRLAQGTLLMCAVVLIWGAFLPVSKFALALIDSYWLTLLRYGVAALCFLVTLAWIEGRRALRFEGGAAKAWLFGSAGIAAFSILVFEGLRLTRPEHGAMILALNPLNIVFWQWLRTGRRPPGATLACIAVALAGIGLVITQGEWGRLYSGGSALGNGLIYLASWCWVAFTLGGQQFPRWSPLRYTTPSVCLGWLSIGRRVGRLRGLNCGDVSQVCWCYAETNRRWASVISALPCDGQAAMIGSHPASHALAPICVSGARSACSSVIRVTTSPHAESSTPSSSTAN